MDSVQFVRRLAVGFAFCVLIMAGCNGKYLFTPHRVDNQPKAGAVNIAVTLVAPWEEYISALSPKFSLESEAALAKVIPQTTVLEEKLLNALSGSLQVGLPQTSITSTVKTLTGQEGTTETSEKIQSKQPGTVPALPAAPSGAEKGAQGLPSIPEDKRAVHMDPILEYTTATALYQEVQLLNHYVTDAALMKGYRTYIVRLQLNVMPFARNQPYDVYVSLGFFYEFNECGKLQNDKTFIVPLLVTDNLEGTLKSRTTDTIRQLALALSFLQSGIAGTLGFSTTREELQSVLGTDINSLFTVGRVNDNTVQARLGASRQPTAGYAMVPRNHSITLVVMVPAASLQKGSQHRVRLIANTLMRDAETGKALPQQDHGARLREVENVLKRHIGEAIPNIEADANKCQELAEAWHFSKDECQGDLQALLMREAIDELLFAVLDNDYGLFKKTLEKAGWTNLKFKRDLWMEIVETLSKNNFSGARIDLPCLTRPALPDEAQAVFLIDDTKTQMTTTLHGGQGLKPERMRASLIIDDNSAPIAATAIIVNAQGGSPVLVFPSLAAWKLKPVAIADAQTLINNARLEITYQQDDRWKTGIGPAPIAPFKKIHYTEKIQTPKPAFELRRTVGIIQADKGLGKVGLYIEFTKDEKKQPLAAKVEITIDAAEAVQVLSDSEGTLAAKLGKIEVTKDGTLEVELRNLDATKKVTFKATALDSKGKPIGGKHDDVVFEVK